jgi:NADPH:quinone reductase-like Zn-dependent oxidoreductase
VSERGNEAVERIMQMTNGIGADAALECVGTQQSMMQAIRSTRPRGGIGYAHPPRAAQAGRLVVPQNRPGKHERAGAFSYPSRMAYFNGDPLPTRLAVGSGFRKASCGRIAAALVYPFKGADHRRAAELACCQAGHVPSGIKNRTMDESIDSSW